MLNLSCYSLLCRSKGLTEEGLASLGYSDTIIFRPGGLRANREKPRPAEKIVGWVHCIAPLTTRPRPLTGTCADPRVITGALSRFSPSFEIRVSFFSVWECTFFPAISECDAPQVETLAQSMCIAGALGSSALPAAAEAITEGKSEAQFTSISNRGAIGLAKTRTEVGDAAKVPASEWYHQTARVAYAFGCTTTIDLITPVLCHNKLYQTVCRPFTRQTWEDISNSKILWNTRPNIDIISVIILERENNPDV